MRRPPLACDTGHEDLASLIAETTAPARKKSYYVKTSKPSPRAPHKLLYRYKHLDALGRWRPEAADTEAQS